MTIDYPRSDLAMQFVDAIVTVIILGQSIKAGGGVQGLFNRLLFLRGDEQTLMAQKTRITEVWKNTQL